MERGRWRRESKEKREGERERGKEGKEKEIEKEFSDIYCVDISFRCDQSTDTLTVAIH